MSILLIEDEASLRDLYCEILREICPCKAVALAEEALEKLTTGYFELVMTDIGLPGIAGDARRWSSRNFETCDVL
jgi:CheY-like chemotaxis protein